MARSAIIRARFNFRTFTRSNLIYSWAVDVLGPRFCQTVGPFLAIGAELCAPEKNVPKKNVRACFDYPPTKEFQYNRDEPLYLVRKARTMGPADKVRGAWWAHCFRQKWQKRNLGLEFSQPGMSNFEHAFERY